MEQVKPGSAHSPFVLHLIPQLHHPDLNPPLPLMIQYPGIRLTMYRWTFQLIDEIPITLSSGSTVCSAGGTLTDLEDSSVAGDVPVGTADNGSAQ